MSTKAKVMGVRSIVDGERCLKTGFVSACLLCFAAAVILSAQVVMADVLPYAGDAVLVLDAQNGLVTNGVNVIGWNDLSAGAHHGVTNTVTPPQLFRKGWNGHDIVSFGGGSSLRLSGQVLSSQQFTVFALVTDEAVSGNREIISNWRNDNQNTSVFFGTAGSATRKVRLTDQMANTPDALALQLPAVFSVLSCVYNGGGDGQIFQDATLLTNMPVNASRNFTTPFHIGVQGGYGSEYWVGRMAQVIVYNRALTSNECAEVRDYLAQHWAPVPGSEFAPAAMTSVTNLQLWLDAADTRTVRQETNPGYVQQWWDKSGHANDAVQGNAGRQPQSGAASLNGLNLLTFTAAKTNTLDNATLSALGDSSRTVIFLTTPFKTASMDVSFGFGGLASLQNTGWCMTDTTIYGINADVSSLTSFGNLGGSNLQIMAVSYDRDATSGHLRRWSNGAVVTAGRNRPSSAYATSSGYRVGTWAREETLRIFTGDIAEILAFDRVINEAERVIVENYLAAKWNPDAPIITLATGSQRYAGYTADNGNYDLDVFGIGRVNSSNAFISCDTCTGLRLSATSAGDDDWLLVGHKTITNSLLIAGAESGVKERWARVWYFDKTDADDSLAVTLTFDFGEGGVSTNGSQYDLLYSSTDPFVFRPITQSSVVSNQIVFTVTSSQIGDGYYTVGRAVGCGPLNLDPLVWLDASETNTLACKNGTVAAWYTLSRWGGNSVAQSNTNAQPTTGAATLNGLNLLTFSTSGTADRLNNSTMKAFGDSSRTVLFLTTPFKTTTSDIPVGLGNTALVANSGWGITDTTVYGIVGANDLTGLTTFGNRGSSNPQIMEVDYDRTLGSGQISRRVNGTVITAGANRPNGGYATTNGFVVGNWANGDRAFGGNIGEVLVFDRTITAAERILINNRLAAKWNPDVPVITLATGTQRYEGSAAANGNYDRDVWGIGCTSDGASQILTGETGKGLRLSAASLGTDDWLLAGHKTVTNVILVTGLETSVRERWERVWYLDKTDTNDTLTATLTFDFGVDHLAAHKADYELLYSAVEPYVFHSLGKASVVDEQVSFTLTSAQIQDGYYTVGRLRKGTLVLFH